MYIFSLKLIIETEDEKSTVAVRKLEVHSSVFSKSELEKIFSIYTPGYSEHPDTLKLLQKNKRTMKCQLNWTTCGRSKDRTLEMKVRLNIYEKSDLGEMSKDWVL